MSDAQVTLRLPFSRERLVLRGTSPTDGVMERIRRGGGYYERHVMAVLRRLVQPDDVLLDAGANVGAVALAAARLAPRGRVFAFEPGEHTHRTLVENVERNHAANVTPLRLALSAESGPLTFSYLPGAAEGSFVSSLIRDGMTGTVPGTSLDDWIDEAGLERLDLVKLDVEGSEREVLAGGRRTLERLRPDLVVECNPASLLRFQGTSPHELLDELRALYPHLYWIAGRGALVRVRDEGHLLELLRVLGLCDLLVTTRGGLDQQIGWQQRVGRHRSLRRVRAGLEAVPRAQYVVERGLRLSVDDAPGRMQPGAVTALSVRLYNGTSSWLSSDVARCPLFVTHSWHPSPSGEEPRTPLRGTLAPGAEGQADLQVVAPPDPGRYELRIRAVQEGYVWLDELDPSLPVTVAIEVGTGVSPSPSMGTGGE